jgi:hypothetical protein
MCNFTISTTHSRAYTQSWMSNEWKIKIKTQILWKEITNRRELFNLMIRWVFTLFKNVSHSFNAFADVLFISGLWNGWPNGENVMKGSLAKLVIYVQLNYFKLDLIIRSHSRVRTIMLKHSCPRNKCVCVCVRACDLRVLKFDFFAVVVLVVGRLKMKFIHSSETRRKSKNAENGVVKLWIEKWMYMLIINFSMWTHNSIKNYWTCLQGWIFQF